MSDVAKIVDRILGDAEMQAQEILSRGESTAQELLARAEAEAQQAFDEAVSGAQAEAQAIGQRGMSGAHTEESKIRLSAKRRLIAEAFRQATDRLNGMSQDEFIKFVEQRLLQTTLTGEAELIVPRRYKDGLMDRLGQNAMLSGLKVSVSDEDRGLSGGFILVCGKVEENYTFDVLVNSMKDELLGDVSQILFQ